MNPVGEAFLEMCTVLEDGPLAEHVDELVELVARVRASIGSLPAELREEFTSYGGRWRTADAIRSEPAVFYDATQVLAARLGDADLLG